MLPYDEAGRLSRPLGAADALVLVDARDGVAGTLPAQCGADSRHAGERFEHLLFSAITCREQMRQRTCTAISRAQSRLGLAA